MDGEPREHRLAGFEAVEADAGRVLPPPAGHPRFALLDSLRAFAAISILIFHVGIVTGGFDDWYMRLLGHLDIGVPVFFLLSGFLIYRPFLASRILGLPAPKIVSYARNRFFRIFPLFWIVLTVSAVVPGFYGAFTGDWWVYYGLLQNFPVYTPGGECAAFPPFRCGIATTWSLSIEVMFYAALPFYAIALAWTQRRLSRVRWYVPELAALLVLSIISFWIQGSFPTSDGHVWLFFSPLGRAWWFAAGMGLAVLSVYCQGKGSMPQPVAWLADRAVWMWVAAIGLYVLLTYVVLGTDQYLNVPVTTAQKYLSGYLAAGIFAILVVFPAIFVAERAGPVRRILAHPVLAWLGLISYGIFLWQFAVIYALVDLGALDFLPALNRPVFFLLVVAGTIGISALSYYGVERPVMLWSRSRGRSSG